MTNVIEEESEASSLGGSVENPSILEIKLGPVRDFGGDTTRVGTKVTTAEKTPVARKQVETDRLLENSPICSFYRTPPKKLRT